MATIKSFTDLSQSKALAEILPLESADMHYNDWAYDFYDGYEHTGEYIADLGKPETICGELDIPCWSLAALLGVLPPYLYEWEKGIDFNLYPSVAKKRWWCAGYISQDLSPENKDKFTLITHADNPIDACYEMILKLYELNLL